MKYVLTFFTGLCFFQSHPVAAQQYEIGHVQIQFLDTSRNRTIPAEIYYPAVQAGEQVPVAPPAGGKYPVLVFGHGFLMAWDAYSNFWNALVPEGYVMVFPTTETGAAPVHDALGEDMSWLAGAMQLETNSNSSIFYQALDTATCVMGHSMGGGAAFLAFSHSTSITGLATFAAAETQPSAIGAASGIQAPALVIAGENDCITPPGSNQEPMYQMLGSSCKTFISIKGASHCQMADPNLICSIGEASCSPGPAITRQQQHDVLFRFLLPWLNYHLRNDCASGILMDSLLAVDASITSQQACSQCTLAGLPESVTDRLRIYPNPSAAVLHLQGLPEDYVICIRDMTSKMILQDRHPEGNLVDIHSFRQGMYLMEIRAPREGTLTHLLFIRE